MKTSIEIFNSLYIKFFLLVINFIFLFNNVSCQTKMFERSYSIPPKEIIADDLIQLNDSGFIVVGNIVTGSTDEIILSRITKSGTILWNKYYSSINNLNVESMILTSDSSLIIVGTQYSSSITGIIFIIKLDLDGNLIWSKQGNLINSEFGISVAESPNGTFVVCGYSFINNVDIFILNFDNSGTMLWGNYLTGAGVSTEFSLAVKVLPNSDIIIAGRHSNSPIILRLDNLGNIKWSKKYSVDSTISCMPSAIDFNNNYEFIVSADFDDTSTFNPALIKVDSLGNLLWMKHYPSNFQVGEIFDAQFCHDNGIISVYEPEHLPPSIIGSRFGLFKTDKDGNIQWGTIYQYANYDFPWAVIQTVDKGFAAVGQIYTTGSSLFLVKTDSNGVAGYCGDTSVLFSPLNYSPIISNINFVTNSYSGLTPFTVTQNTLSYVDSIYCTTQVGIEENSILENNISIYPNPFYSQVTLQTSFPLINATLTIDNYFGQTVLEIKNINEQSITLSRGNLPSGFYLLKLTERNKIIGVNKIIIIDY